MGYDSKHITMLDPASGYNLIAKEYGKYHDHLDSFDKWFFLRFLPREKKVYRILDLGAWDGRMYKWLKNLTVERYVACDIAEKLLARHPGKVEKVVCNLENKLPFADEAFNLVTSFFVLEHIEHIAQLFDEVGRVLESGWVRIIGHFIQRREFVWKKDKEQFKINIINHRIQDLEKIAQKSGFSLHSSPVHEGNALIGHILVCEKS
jgi:ubiquinone/menaquinone biosynthesis C-methylase UbiE